MTNRYPRESAIIVCMAITSVIASATYPMTGFSSIRKTQKSESSPYIALAHIPTFSARKRNTR